MHELAPLSVLLSFISIKFETIYLYGVMMTFYLYQFGTLIWHVIFQFKSPRPMIVWKRLFSCTAGALVYHYLCSPNDIEICFIKYDASGVTHYWLFNTGGWVKLSTTMVGKIKIAPKKRIPKTESLKGNKN